MDSLKNMLGGSSSTHSTTESTGQHPATETTHKPIDQATASGNSFTDKINSALGGGKASEKNEDALDKAVDTFQERVMGQGPQDNESALEQAKDEQISDCMYKCYFF